MSHGTWAVTRAKQMETIMAQRYEDDDHHMRSHRSDRAQDRAEDRGATASSRWRDDGDDYGPARGDRSQGGRGWGERREDMYGDHDGQRGGRAFGQAGYGRGDYGQWGQHGDGYSYGESHPEQRGQGFRDQGRDWQSGTAGRG